jgi:hypothetical protein
LKIFGVNIPWWNEPTVVEDQIPEVQAPIPDTKKPALMRPVKNPVLVYRTTRFVGRGAFTPSEYDLGEIGRIEDTDSYVRQAFDKKVALMFKEGWDFVGPNTRTIQYLKTRLAQIAQASQVPTPALLRGIGSGLIRKSNAFLIKVRKTEASGGRVRSEPGKKNALKPVAGYFIAPAESMEFQLEGNKITKWRQKMPNGDYKDYSPRDVVHFHYDRKDGFVFGTPHLTPVIDDVRALRKIEENIEMLVYQHLFPIFQYRVGTPESPAGLTEDGRREIDVVRTEIQYMPSEGGIVTPERHEIIPIGAEGKTLRAEGYLEHFKKRVFAGLGVSAVDMGEGETANRATADNMSRNLVDSVKDFQQVMELFVNDFMINELLLESTFGDSILDEDNRCYLKFKEIDIDAQIKKETHFADQFTKNVINLDEARTGQGREPLLIPTPEEVDTGEDLSQKYPAWHRMYWKLFKEPELLIQSLDEPYSPLAKAIARSSSLETTSSDVEEAGEKQKKRDIEIEKEKAKAKPAFARPSRPKRKDGYLADTYTQITETVVTKVSIEQKVNKDWIAQLVRTALGTTIQRLIADQIGAFRAGIVSVGLVDRNKLPAMVSSARKVFTTRAERYVNRLTNHVANAIKRRVDSEVKPEELAGQVRAVMDAFQYRTAFIEDVEVRKAENWGRLQAWKQQGLETLWSFSPTPKSMCDICRPHHRQGVSPTLVDIEDIPPFHAHCNCHLVSQQELVQVTDEIGSLPPPKGYKMSGEDVDKPLKGTGNIATCPECGKTAIEISKMPGYFVCRACKTTFQVKKDATKSRLGPKSKQAEFRKCVQRAKARLKAQHPNFDDGRIEMMAETACDYLLHADAADLTDGEKMDRCVSKVKAQLKAKNPGWSTDRVTSSAFAICNTSLKGK